MLALSDAIGATRIAPHARGRWLIRLAKRLDPPSRPLTRQGRWRSRERNTGKKLQLHSAKKLQPK
jgi:hypothetical protein